MEVSCPEKPPKVGFDYHVHRPFDLSFIPVREEGIYPDLWQY